MSFARLCVLGIVCFGSAAHAQTIGNNENQTPPGPGQRVGASAALGIAPSAAATAGGEGTESSVSTFPVPPINEGLLSYDGITVYGGIDLGVGYESHGTPTNGAYGPGNEYLLSKNSNHSQFGEAPNALSYSNIGLRGKELLIPGLSFIFNMQTTFNPYSFRLSDGLKSLQENNGVALDRQTSNGDSSRAGQGLNSFYYAGFSSPDFGALTFGRQNTITLDKVIEYDPMSASNAFSVIGYQGATAGGGDTEDARLDNAAKYSVVYGPLHFGALYQVPSFNATGWPHSAYQLDAGATFGGLSVDGVFSKIHGAISAASLTAPQVLVEPAGSLAATVSDNTSIMFAAKYKVGAMTYLAGYERIGYANPHDAVDAPFTNISGYTMSVVNNDAFPQQKTLQVFWAGGRYAVTRQLDVLGAYYHEGQNSYGAHACHTSAAPTCSGALDALSLVADYHFTKQYDAYAGAMYSTAADGLASGYLNRNTVDPTVGLRVQF
jgi:predicted porin